MKEHTALTQLSDSALLSNLEQLSVRENETTIEILLHLAEVERRKLFVGLGYSSLFSYCTEKLKYSEPGANRRISSARAASRFPEVLELLRTKEISLTTLSLVSGMLTEENRQDVLKAISGKGRREVEMFLATYRPRPQVAERIRPVCVVAKKRVKQAPAGLGDLFAVLPPTVESTFTGEGREENDRELPVEERFEVRFSISAEVMAKLEEAKSLLSGKFPEGVGLEEVFGEGLELLLEKRSPRRREKRRVQRIKSAKAKPSKPAKRSRHIPQQVRDRVYLRDEGRCTFVGSDGVRCSALHDVEVHHLEPFGRGGAHEESNLALLCRRHNVFDAERVYGLAREESRDNAQRSRRVWPDR